jgi:hypothetical protein
MRACLLLQRVLDAEVFNQFVDGVRLQKASRKKCVICKARKAVELGEWRQKACARRAQEQWQSS